MNLKFFWTISDDMPSPNCQSDSVDKDGVSPLECLLTDDGGQPYLSTIPWLEAGLNSIDLVKTGMAERQHWDRECWGAELSQSQVRVYSLYDENCAETLSLSAFELALSGWAAFLRSQPDAQRVTTIPLP
ncbi:MAG: hypothetical protein HY855_06350 [Burkholderiales bacterium]|nr:hypothetical protein [Burkholderiales bacterium]